MNLYVDLSVLEAAIRCEASGVQALGMAKNKINGRSLRRSIYNGSPTVGVIEKHPSVCDDIAV
jgi:hypothetical protein